MSNTLRRGLTVVFLAFVGIQMTSAQYATVRGFVTDDGGQALFGVNIVVQNDEGAFFGAASDAEGFYIIPRIDPGAYTVIWRYIGFEEQSRQITFSGGEIQNINVQMRVSAQQLDELVVESERESGAARTDAGLQRVTAQDIELIPAPDVSADLVNYITAMPGVVSSGDRGGQLFIRGGEPTQNLVLIDGMQVFQPFHILGFYSAFPADIVRSSDIYAGGFGAQYGGRLSSVLDVDTRNGNNRSYRGAVTAAPFVSSLMMEGPLVKERSSFIVSGRHSVIEQGAARLVDQPLPYRFGDLFGKIHTRIGESSQVSFSVLATTDQGVVGVNEERADINSATQDQVKWQNLAFGGRYVFLPTNLPMFAEIKISRSGLEQGFGPVDAPSRTTSTQQLDFSTDLTYYASRVDVQWGMFLTSYRLSNALNGQFQGLNENTQNVTEVGLYLEPLIRVSEALEVRAGLRLHAFPSNTLSFVEPRFRAAYTKGVHRISAAAGVYHQEITGLNDRRDAGDVFTAWTVTPLGLVPEAKHAILGYQLTTGKLDFSLEGFVKDMTDLSIPEWTSFPRFTVRLQPADGDAYGYDVRAGFTGDRFTGFLTYGYSKVRYYARGRSIAIWYGADREEFSPPHDRTHQMSAVTSFNLGNFSISARWQYGSGTPFSRSLGFDTFILMKPEQDLTQESGLLRVLYGQPYDGRLPSYHRLDISADQKFETRHADVTLQAGLINAYDRDNLFYMDLFTRGRVNQLPVIPSFGLKVEIK